MADDDLHRIELRAKSIEELRSYLDGSNVDLGCRPAVRREGDDFVVEVYSRMPEVERLRSSRSAAGVRMNVIENASEVGRARPGGGRLRQSIRRPHGRAARPRDQGVAPWLT